MTRKNFKSLAEVAIFSEEMKGTFPLTNRAYRLLLTAPVTVAKDERIFSRLKLIKTHLRTTMTEKRLEALMMLSCEKDLTDNANLDKIAENWAVLKSRKVKRFFANKNTYLYQHFLYTVAYRVVIDFEV